MRILRYLLLISVLAVPSWAVNRTVKAGGGGDFTTIQACATAMAAGDTCTVFAGTYAESVTVTAGTAGNYKTITVNGTDTVKVTAFTLGSHTQLIGNCAAPAAINTCGFTFNPSSAGASCVTISSNATDVFIRNNTLQSCGRINPTSGTTFYYIQGNTFAYAGCVPPNPVNTCGQHIADWGDNSLVENNDFSHYQLAGNLQGTHHVWRNNTFHDQLDAEAGSNTHTDAIFMEPNFTTGQIVAEGNFQRNSVGPNAKQMLNQNDACSPGPCTFGSIIERFNIVSGMGLAAITNDKSWAQVKVYNNDYVDEGQTSPFVSPGGGGDNMLSSGAGLAVLNSIWFVGTATFTNWNPYACSGCASFGHNLYWCISSCTNVFNHVYQGSTFTADPGNLHANPLFVNYVSPASTSNNFHLQSGSPAIAAGTSLTTVSASDTGSGTSLIVADATYFQDGYGLSNPYTTMQGDCIAVGTVSNTVCVTAVNYSTNTLTLANTISRSSGQAVWLFKKSDGVQVLNGAAPDMGALPFSSGTFTITISSIVGQGTVTSSDSVVNCTTGTTGTCVDSGVTGSVTLTATPTSGWQFTSWGGGTCSGAATTCVVSSTATITATFTKIVTFTIAPTTIPANHSGHILLTLTGTGTSWNGSTTFTFGGTTGSSLVSCSNSSAISETCTVTTGTGTGTGTLTDTTEGISSNVAVANATLAVSPSSGGESTTPTVTLTGTNTLWSSETAAGLFTAAGSGCSGTSIGTPTVTTNTSATATLTVGSAICTITITDTSTTATANFSVSLGVTPISFSYGSQTLFTVTTNAFTISNNSGTAITISSLALSGTNAGDYYLSTHTCGALPSSLAGHASCTVTVGFMPLVTGSRTATLTVTDTPDSIAVSSALSGAGTVLPQPVQLVQNWVNNLEYIGTTTNTINYPASGTGGHWTCAANSTTYPDYAANSCSATNGLQKAANDAAACRAAGGTGTLISIVPGSKFSGANCLILNQDIGDTSTNFIVFNSTTPLPMGQTACSHGSAPQDNIPESTQIAFRNPDCAGDSLSYMLGVTSTSIPAGPFTQANGTPDNTANYDDIASMYTIENTAVNGNAVQTGLWDANNLGPHHYAILNAEIRPLAGVISVNAPVAIGQTTETLTSQIPNHIHLAYDYLHGDWTDAPMSGGVVTGSPTGFNQLPNVISMSECEQCSLAYNYADKAIRPGGEGHIVSFNMSQQIKIVHNWFEGESITHLCGGQQSPLTIPFFTVCEDMEDRANRWSYPYSWMLAANAGYTLDSSMPTTGGGGSGAILNLTSSNGRTAALAAVTGVALQSGGGGGYAAGNILAPTMTGNNVVGTGATVEVTSVSAGAVTGVEVVTGTGYHVASNLPTVVQSPGTGTGLTVNITAVDGSGRIVSATVNTPGSNYTPSDNVTVTQSGGSGGLLAITGTATGGVPQGLLVASGAGYSLLPFGRKNMHEYKGAHRVVNDGDVFEDADYTGVQGTGISAKTSAGDPFNYQVQTTNFTITNNIIRHGCNGASLGDRSDNGPSNGFGISAQSSLYNFSNNLMYDLSNANPACTGTPGPYALRVAASTTGSTWAGSVGIRDSLGLTTTFLLGGGGQHYVTGNNLTTTATTGTGSGLTVNITAVNSFGQVTAVGIGGTPGSGYATGDDVTINQVGSDGTASVTIDTQTGGVPTLLVIGFANGTAVGQFSVGDPVVVTGCGDNSFNSYTSLPFATSGFRAITGTVALGLVVVVPNPGTAGATTTGCAVSNIQGTPQYLTATHNSDFMVLPANVTGDPGSSSKGTAAAPCLLSTTFTYTNSISVGGGPDANSLGEGFRTSDCAFDPLTEVYNFTAVPGRDSAVTCPGHTTAGPGGLAICYKEYNGSGAGFTPSTLYSPLNPNCNGNDPTTESCLGIVGAMGQSSFPYQLSDWTQYALCHGQAACNGKTSSFAAGGANQASDGTDLGANFAAILAAQTSTKYFCNTPCGTGPFPDAPAQGNTNGPQVSGQIQFKGSVVIK